MMSKEGEIRRDEACLDYAGSDVTVYPCHGSKGNQLWHYDDEVRMDWPPISKSFMSFYIFSSGFSDQNAEARVEPQVHGHQWEKGQAADGDLQLFG